jgi:RNA polymerase sigma-70 factor (ECF subfamily)
MTEDRLTSLYRMYGPVIYRRCVGMLLDQAAAEDATQETFMRVYNHLDKAPDPQQALGWIYRIATNYCLNEIRNRKLRPQPVERLPEKAAAGAEEQHINRQLVTRLAARLPEKVGSVAWLHYVDGMDQGEVAQVLGISRRTVVNRLATFQERAQKYIKGNA